jgi:hypothetical protein
MKSFGVGCFHFSIKKNNTNTITVKEYISEVVRSLEKLSTISDIEYFYDESLKDEELDLSESTSMQDGQHCFPCIPFLNLSFNIYIPKRIQASVINEEVEYIDTETENFKVNFINAWHGPLTFIECSQASVETSASTAIQIVREYLIKEYDLLDTFLFLDFIGPSPFHADFFLNCEMKSQGEHGDKFTLEHVKKPGYDQLNFNYNQHAFDTEDNALESLYRALRDEISFFYSLHCMRSSDIDDWGDIQESMHALLEFENDDIKKSFKDKLFLKPKLFKKVFKDIGLFKGKAIYLKSLIEQQYFSIYKSEKHTVYLESYNQRIVSEWQKYPVQETAELLLYFDQKNSKSLELSIIFTAAVLGGAIGAAITVLFS